MGIAVSKGDGDGGLAPSETMDLLQQRGSLRRLVREAMAGSGPHIPDWKRRAERLLAMKNWAEYEVT